MFVPLLITAVLVYAFYWWTHSKPRNFPPGPPVLPIVGSLFSLPKQYIHFTMEEWEKKYGRIVGAILPGHFMIYVSGYNAIQEILHRDEFQGRPDNEFVRQRSFNKRLGVIFTDGPYWVEQRRFTLRHLRDLGFGKSSMDAVVHEEVDDLFETFRNKTELEVTGLFNRSILNILWAIVAGHRFSRDDEKFKDLQMRMKRLSTGTSTRGNLANLFPILKLIAPKPTGFTETTETIAAMQNMLQDTIEEHKKTIDPDYSRDFIDVYIKEIEHQKETTGTSFTDESLVIVCFDLFTGGAESVSNSLAFALLYMVLYPEIQKKVQKDIDEVIGKNRKPCVTDRPQLPYIEAVLTEVSRINPIGPITPPHTALKDTNLFGYHIPKGSLLVPSLWSVLHDKKHWGDPESFRPERFINADGKFVKDDYVILFGAGKRICIGERLSENSLFTFFTCLLQKYSFSLPPYSSKPSTKGVHGFTASPQPFKVLITERD